ncbi:uncharacterized protein GGS25DRAFT_472933, partial [Hypoxylon fragiforme]|uniref:uncharacterized protein n=1 Tax=Hypoxylon fragiforme TaxID=63214 RepID=UPI0020C68C14
MDVDRWIATFMAIYCCRCMGIFLLLLPYGHISIAVAVWAYLYCCCYSLLNFIGVYIVSLRRWEFSFFFLFYILI